MKISPQPNRDCARFTHPESIFAHRAFTLVELIVVIAIMAIVVAIVLPGRNIAQDKARRIKCVSNLKNVGLAHRIFATDNGDLFPWERSRADATALTNFPNLNNLTAGDQVVRLFQTLSNELSTPKIILCPADTRQRRREATNWHSLATNNISYFLGVSAQETYPQSFLVGDRNLLINGQPASGRVDITNSTNVTWSRAMHKGQGTACMGDGSVQQLSSARLQAQLMNTGIPTNTFIFP
jgi:prepilin-type N-terminal cleavage/methylation domain-containing protein